MAPVLLRQPSCNPPILRQQRHLLILRWIVLYVFLDTYQDSNGPARILRAGLRKFEKYHGPVWIFKMLRTGPKIFGPFRTLIFAYDKIKLISIFPIYMECWFRYQKLSTKMIWSLSHIKLFWPILHLQSQSLEITLLHVRVLLTMVKVLLLTVIYFFLFI